VSSVENGHVVTSPFASPASFSGEDAWKKSTACGRHISVTRLYQFMRLMNPRLYTRDISELMAMVDFGETDEHGIGLVTETEFCLFLRKYTAGLDKARFEGHCRHWMKAREVMGNAQMANILRKQAEKWYRGERDIRSPTVPPPLFEPEKDGLKRKDSTEDMLTAKALVDRGMEQLVRHKHLTSNVVNGLKRDHPILNLFTGFTALERHQQIMILFVDVMSALFVEAVLFDFSSGGALGGFGAVDSATNAATGADSTSIDAALEAYIVFGIMGGVCASLVSLAVIGLFETAQRKRLQIDRFDRLARRAPTKIEDLSVTMPVPKLRFELFTAQSRLSLARRHYDAYAASERKQGRSPVSRDMMLGILEMNVGDVESLLKRAEAVRTLNDKKKIATRLESNGVRGLAQSIFARRAARAQLQKERQKEEFDFHLAQLPEFDRQLFLQNLDSYEQMGRVQGFFYWNILMNDDEKFEVIRDHVRGRTGYLACAWVLSILWCAWCLLFVLTWLFQADNSEEHGFDPKDWVKAFAVSSAFDFVVFTPLVIAIRIVFVPIVFVSCSKPKVSASYDHDRFSVVTVVNANAPQKTNLAREPAVNATALEEFAEGGLRENTFTV